MQFRRRHRTANPLGAPYGVSMVRQAKTRRPLLAAADAGQAVRVTWRSGFWIDLTGKRVLLADLEVRPDRYTRWRIKLAKIHQISVLGGYEVLVEQSVRRRAARTLASQVAPPPTDS